MSNVKLEFQLPEARELQAYSIPKEDGTNGFYWRDRVNIQGSGPFEYLYEAMNHYSWTLHLRKEEQRLGPMPDNVIYVDFKTKKRA